MPKTVEQVVVENLGGLQFILCQKEVEITNLKEQVAVQAEEISNLKAKLELLSKKRPVSGQNKG